MLSLGCISVLVFSGFTQERKKKGKLLGTPFISLLRFDFIRCNPFVKLTQERKIRCILFIINQGMDIIDHTPVNFFMLI